MATVELTKDNFSDVVSSAELVLVDFWASWCGPCRSFGPVFEEASERHPDAVFGKVDTEAQRELATAFRVMSIPTLAVIREGLVLYAKSGALPLEALDDLVGRARALDMDEVRRNRAARQQPV
ncbi:MAG: thioredoxin domain-containing protein [Actinomycetota bacterium]|nr:thioredoxin domain-containing protein [Actinomycetota bacterium]